MSGVRIAESLESARQRPARGPYQFSMSSATCLTQRVVDFFRTYMSDTRAIGKRGFHCVERRLAPRPELERQRTLVQKHAEAI